MTVVAGIDVGNATTEVVAVRHAANGLEVLGADCLPTRGRKGSIDSLRGAAALVRRVERALGTRIDAGVVAPLRAVETSTLSIPELAPATGRLRIVASAVDTPGGRGACIGPPVPLESVFDVAGAAGAPSRSRPERPFVVLLPRGLGYRAAADRLRCLRDEGWPIGGVLVPGDEGVLISNRLGADIPVVDLVDTEGLAAASMVGVEVRDPGRPVRLLSDPIALGAGFGLGRGELEDAAAVCRLLLDSSNAVVALEAAAAAAPGRDEGWIEMGGARSLFRGMVPRLAKCPPGTVTAFAAPGSSSGTHVGDLWVVDLGAVADSASQRKGSLASRAFVLAALGRRTDGDSPAARMSDLLELPVVCAPSETAAARTGALTTPGALPHALVIDIGGGTIDVIAPESEVIAAGAGEMLTVGVAVTLGLPLAAADWVKRGPSLRVEGGQRYEAEDGTRGFLERPVAPAATGMLAVTGPAGMMPFDRRHSPAEWRTMRLRLKEAVVATNLKRALLLLDADPRQVLIVGGPTGDDELLGVLARSLPGEVAIGRGAVGGSLASAGHSSVVLGHRYAAALGLAMAAEAADL
ncbi:MAG TPA: diol dehydratase reactivase ATPase-like domain-containing protein [Acidimicrobiales bacterium]|nr:diol dehydratase reactivase ATPase-like domain-containing protein [Acidimicrobiales bacterium]